MSYPLCIHCKWFLASKLNIDALHQCLASEQVNLVTGKVDYFYCDTMRNSSSQCGRDGKFYEANISDEPEVSHVE